MFMQNQKIIIQPQNTNEPLWTQEESIAFECAQEAIVDMMAICSSEIELEKKKPFSNINKIKSLNTARSNLDDEYSELRWDDRDKIARIRRDYGSKIYHHKKGDNIF